MLAQGSHSLFLSAHGKSGEGGELGEGGGLGGGGVVGGGGGGDSDGGSWLGDGGGDTEGGGGGGLSPSDAPHACVTLQTVCSVAQSTAETVF